MIYNGLIIALLLSYLLGSIPFGLIFTKLFNLGDVRTIGSGNIGATNVLRTGSKLVAFLTLLGDMLKGTLAVYLTNLLFGSDIALYAGLAAFLGHLFPIWLKFKGGKGVATFLGVLIAIHYMLAVYFVIVWLLVALISKYSSLAALVSCTVVTIIALILNLPHTALVLFIMTLLIYLKHNGNIKRLYKGKEKKIFS